MQFLHQTDMQLYPFDINILISEHHQLKPGTSKSPVQYKSPTPPNLTAVKYAARLHCDDQQ